MSKYYLKKEYHPYAYNLATQPIGMSLSNLDVTKPLHIIEKCDWGDNTMCVRYSTVAGQKPFGYVDMKFLIKSGAKKRTGKRKRKLKQRKGTPRK